MVLHKCTSCQKTFKNKIALTNHEKKLHSEMIEYYTCPSCNKTMKYLKNFCKHYMDTHKGSLKEAKVVEKTLQPQYSNNTNTNESKCILLCDTCKCWQQRQKC